MSLVFLVQKYMSNGSHEVQGIFTDLNIAKIYAKKHHYGIMSVVLDQCLPDKIVDARGFYWYPDCEPMPETFLNEERIYKS